MERNMLRIRIDKEKTVSQGYPMASQTTDRSQVDGLHMASHGKRRISVNKQAQDRQKKSDMMEN